MSLTLEANLTGVKLEPRWLVAASDGAGTWRIHEQCWQHPERFTDSNLSQCPSQQRVIHVTPDRFNRATKSSKFSPSHPASFGYRPLHRGQTSRGLVAWQPFSYYRTLGCKRRVVDEWIVVTTTDSSKQSMITIQNQNNRPDSVRVQLERDRLVTQRLISHLDRIGRVLVYQFQPAPGHASTNSKNHPH